MHETLPEPAVLLHPAVSRPAEDRERVVPLDVLRGFALLGILVMNIQSFAMIDAAYMNPTAYGDFTGANYWVWFLSHILADQKMMTIFSMLFGAGIVLMTQRSEAATHSSAGLHYRRMGILVVFGMLHGYLLWYGDILYSYALCGMFAYLLRNLRPGWLILLGFSLITIPSGISLLMGWSMQFWSPEDMEGFVRDAWKPTDEMIADQIAAYRGNWWVEIVHRAPITLGFQTFLFLILVGWRVSGLMLVGMALFKLGVFHAARSIWFYGTMIGLAAAVGIPMILWGVHQNIEAGWAAQYSFFFGGQYNYWGSLIVSGGWVGLMMLACKNRRITPLTRPLAAVGQMALTNYFLQTIIATTLFYGRGLGLYGQVERVGQILIVFAIWAVQLIISPIWLAYFRFGPAEWLWRSLTYGRFQPMGRGGDAAV